MELKFVHFSEFFLAFLSNNFERETCNFNDCILNSVTISIYFDSFLHDRQWLNLGLFKAMSNNISCCFKACKTGTSLTNTECKKTAFTIDTSGANSHWIPTNFVQNHADTVNLVSFDINICYFAVKPCQALQSLNNFDETAYKGNSNSVKK